MPWVSLDELYMFDPSTWMVYWGWELVAYDAQLHFAHEASGEEIDVRITDYQPQMEWFRSGADELVPVYRFSAKSNYDAFPEFNPICINAETGEDWGIVFRGDKYSQNLKVLPNDPSNGWSFLACNGSAAMKLHLHRHTYAGQFNNVYELAYPTDVNERTTLLKAITADYCGIGHPFTVSGTPLSYATAQDPTRFPEPYELHQIDKIEALWTPTGAHCLDKTRLVDREEVDAMCWVPDCGIWNPLPPTDWNFEFHAITAVPHVGAVPLP
jgi:hypothetical protein